MNAADNSIDRILICLLITGFLHSLILWGVSVPTTTVSDNNIELKIKWAPHKMKEKRKQLAESPIETKSAHKNNAAIIQDDQNTSSSTQLGKNDNFFFEGRDLAKRVAKNFQQSSHEKKDTRVNEKLAPVILSYLNSWDRKCERLGRSNFGLNQPAGFLTIELTLLSDGRLQSAQVVKSSRVTELDKHALKTVERAAPHLPFPPEMRKNYTKLTFQRTWQYGHHGTTITSA
jgi:TonB family protein